LWIYNKHPRKAIGLESGRLDMPSYIWKNATKGVMLNNALD